MHHEVAEKTVNMAVMLLFTLNCVELHDKAVGSHSYLWQLLIFREWMQSEMRVNR